MTKTTVDWPAARGIEMVPLAKITPHPDNPRTHPDAQLDGLGAAFDEFGVVVPPIVDENFRLMAGEGRWLAAKKKNFAELPCIVVRGWSEKKKKRFVVADNRLPMLAGYDDALYRSILAQIKDDGVLAAIGFDETSLAEALANPNAGLVDPDEQAPAPKKPIVRTGDLWLLGDHRLLCGDSTSKHDVGRVMDGAIVKLFVTDPPYGVAFERGQFVGPTKKAKGEVFAPMANDHLTGDKLRDFIALAIDCAFENRDGVFYVWQAFHEGYAIQQGMERAKIKIQSQIVWSKTPFVLGSADYHWQHETCLYGFKGKNHPWYGGRKQGTVWEIPKPQKMEFHPTQKPVECMRRPILNNSRKGEFVYEPFSGSGTTIIACEMTGRKALAIDVSPVYVQVAIERWQKFSGKLATLDGKTLEQVGQSRRRSRAAQALAASNAKGAAETAAPPK